MITWQIKNVISLFSQGLCTPNLAGGDLGWGDLIYKVTWHIDWVVTWQIKNVISSLSQGLWTPNLAWRWLRVTRSHPQIHVTLQYRGHVTNKKRYISTFTRLMDPNVAGRLRTRDLTNKVTDTSITWSRVKSKMFYLHIHKAPGPQNLVGCWIRMRGTHLGDSRDTSIVWSREKWKTSYLFKHRAVEM